MKRILSILAAAVVTVLVTVAPAWGQSDAWAGSGFDDSDLQAGGGTRASSTFTVGGSFEHSGRDIVDVSASISAPGAACTPETSQPTPSNTRSSAFALTVSSTCNVERATITLTAKARRSCNVWNVCDSPPNGTLSTQVTIAAPARPVTGLTASVPDATSKDVSVSWAFPEGAAAETTYRVVRIGPAPGSTVAPESTEDDPTEDTTSESEPQSTSVELASGDAGTIGTSLTDTVEFNGIYTYQVTSTRPLVDPVAASVDVRVGPGPKVDNDDDDDDTDGDTTTTITLPEGRAPISVPRRSGGGRVSSHTTVATVPRSPATTIDTGYEETLDYHLDDIEPGELAAEGQSILSTDDDSNVIGPGAVGAAALVLLGWAGHYVYFRRLAAQF